MSEMTLGCVLLIIGLAVITFRKRLARYHAAFQKESLNLHLSDKDNKANEWMGAIFGTTLIILGILISFNIVSRGDQVRNDTSHTQDILSSLVFIVVGIAQLIFRDKFQRLRIGDQKKVPKISVGKMDFDLTNAMIVAFSLALIITGLWSLSEATGWR